MWEEKLRKTLASTVMLTFFLSSIVEVTDVWAKPGTVVAMDPSLIEYDHYAVGETFTVAVRIQDVEELYGFDVQIGWNTTWIEYVSHIVKVPVESYPDGVLHSPILLLKDEVNESGIPIAEPSTMLWVAYSSLYPVSTFNGSGTACEITFRIKDYPIIPDPSIEFYIHFVVSYLGDPYPCGGIPHTTQDCHIIFHSAPTGPIYIRADGSVDPPTAPIQRDGEIYTFSNNIINATIVVERENVVIDGNGYIFKGSGTGYGFDLRANNVTIRNTTITDFYIGICWDDYSHQKIVNNEITDTGMGIYLGTMFGRDTIIGNRIVGNIIAVFMDGMDSSVDIINNTMIDNGAGILLWSFCGCWGGRIIGNIVVNSGADGIELSEVTCLLRDNVLINSGLSVGGLGIDHYLQDIDVSNTINGRPIYYWIGEENKTIPQNAGYVALVCCKNMLVENLTLSGNGQGVVLTGTTDSIVRNLNILHNYVGFVLTDSSRNRIYSNNVTQCGCPVLGMDSKDNIVYHNNFIGNRYPPWIINSQDSWDAGYPFGGNYWSDYNGTDLYCGAHQNFNGSDGVGDTPYIFEELGSERNYTDRYPLMEPWTPSWEPIPPLLIGDINYDGKVDLYDVVLVGKAYGSTPEDPNWNPLADLAPPYGIINLYDAVTIAYHYGEKYS